MVVDTAAYSTITPLLPELVDDLDLSKAGAGALTAAFPVGTLLLAIPAGLLASRVGAKVTVMVGLVTLAGASVVFGFADSAFVMTAARAVQGFGGSAVWAGGLAWVVASAPRELRAGAIGTAIGAAIAGSLLGPVLGAAADEFGRGVVLSAFVALPAGLMVALMRLPGPAIVPTPGLQAVRTALTDRVLRRGIWLMALPSAGFGMIMVLIPLRLDELGAGATAIGAIFLGIVALEASMSPLAGRLTDRRSALAPVRFGLVAGGIGFMLLPWPETAVSLAVVTVGTATVLGLLWAPAMSLMSDRAEERGLDVAIAFALGNLAWGAGSAAGGSGGGALAEVTTDAVPFLVVAVLALLTVAHGRDLRIPRLTRARTP